MASTVIYTLQVINVNTQLRGRTAPNITASVSAYKKNGQTFKSSKLEVRAGYTWYQEDSSGLWFCFSKPDGTKYLKVIGKTSPDPKPVTNPVSGGGSSSNPNVGTSPSRVVADPGSNRSANLLDADNSTSYGGSVTNIIGGTYRPTYGIVNSANFPRNVGTEDKPEYDYRINIGELQLDTTNGKMSGTQYLKEIKENLNIYSAWSKLEANNKYHTEFNRFKIDHPDVFIRNTVGYIVFTRPDLNLFDASGNMRDEISVDPRCEYIVKHNPHIAQSLTHAYDGKSGHNFNPFLSNLAQGVDVQDDQVDVLDTGETYTGYKMQYSKHNIKSLVGGQINVKFRETFELGVTNLFQLWVDYQSNVYRGAVTPIDDYIWYKNIDYMCNLYYFLLDQDGETVLFWTKYFGVFPQNVPKNTFSFDMGSQIQLPEVNVTFSYIYKEDLSPMTFVEFNKDAGIENMGSIAYAPSYNKELGISGRTWVGVPFVSSCRTNNGIVSDSYGFKLRFRSPDTIKTGSATVELDSRTFSGSSNDTSNMNDREYVHFMTGVEDRTMTFMDGHNVPSELYRKLANAIKNKLANGKRGTNREIVQKMCGFANSTMTYLDGWFAAQELYRKIVVAASGAKGVI